MRLYVLDLTYSDGSVVRLHHEAETKRQALRWLQAHLTQYLRPALTLTSVLILRGIDGRTL